MITDTGWFDWAIRMPGNAWQVNVGRNSLRGLVAHSAEGYESNLLDPNSPWGYKGNHSWHATNLFEGRFIQHHSLFSQTWHANVMNAFTAGIENEGVDEHLTVAQVNNLVRACKDIAAFKGYTKFARLTATDNPSAFLLAEHNQAVLFGGPSTECPSGRIPWEEILKRLTPEQLHVAQVRLSGKFIYVKFAGSGTITIGDGDEWPLVVTECDFVPETVCQILPPG